MLHVQPNLAIIPGPLNHTFVVTRVGINADNHLGEVGVMGAKRGLAPARPLDRAVDLIEVHG